MTDHRLTATQAAVSVLLNDIAGRFKPGAKLTLVVRNPTAEAAGKDADFVMTNDTLDEAMAALQRRKDAKR
jgi:hypothetical protein|nr:hypothetical protein [uncultured Sphingomonas sp.]